MRPTACTVRGELFAAQAEARVADRLTAVAGSCGPGNLHFINGIFEANRNRAPVILIASQIIRDELGFDFIQEVDFKDRSVFCDMIHTPEQAIDVLAPHLRSCIAVVDEPTLLNLQER
jgi:thiamine pyrophosphate-dependent acetolactate synthase large subunit-like protein